MIKMLITFVCLFIIFYTGIEILNKMSGKERWEVAKTFSYSVALALTVVVCMVLMVVMF
jgi:DMSO/TMAO reductase YedYZ heme-binding membrane subunit